jgi:mono/diheme cytochrome c family protein
MNYPVWYIPTVGGSLIIASIAILHVLVSHFAVGGGLWLVITERKAYKDNKEFILDYVRKHTKFFMLLTMVFGAFTGVGIWFAIALIHPDATSTLIHSFVFGWAIEWVFFVIEIVTAFLYFYTFKKISEKTHLLVGWIYFIAALASLIIINAILSFMLTPGKWLETRNFWDGVFNPSFWSSSVFRIFLSFAMAGSYGLLTAAKKFTGDEKKTLIRYNGKWILYSLTGLIPSMIWFYTDLPQQAKNGLVGTSRVMRLSLFHLLAGLAVFLVLWLLFVLWKPGKLSFQGSIVVLLSIFVFVGAFEFIREAGRKPYIISQYMYATGLTVSQQEKLKDKSILQHAKWVRTKEITPANELTAGEELFRIQCSACHSFGIKNNINGIMAQRDLGQITRNIGSLRGITPFMPAFVGTTAEKKALAKWIFSITHKGKPALESPPPETVTVQGETVFKTHCADCHEIDGTDSVSLKIKSLESKEAIIEMLGKLPELNEDMPPFEGTEEEKKTLADYLDRLRSDK